MQRNPPEAQRLIALGIRRHQSKDGGTSKTVLSHDGAGSVGIITIYG